MMRAILAKGVGSLVDAEFCRLIVPIMDLPCRALHNAATGASAPACTSYSSASIRVNDGVRELSTNVAQKGSAQKGSKQQEHSKEKQMAMDEYEEQEANHKANFEKVKPAPQATKQQWWRPDPETGIWVPEQYEGQVTTSTPTMKSPSRQARIRSETTTSLEDKKWWTSMEELPDMDRGR